MSYSLATHLKEKDDQICLFSAQLMYKVMYPFYYIYYDLAKYKYK